MQVTGGCLCGAVRFACDATPIASRACWCRDCQYWACGNAALNVFLPTAALHVTGAIATYDSAADSGNAMRRSFCPTCGTPLFSAAQSQPELLVIRVGALDDTELGKPQSVIWSGSRPSWGWDDPTIPSCAAQPAPINSR